MKHFETDRGVNRLPDTKLPVTRLSFRALQIKNFEPLAFVGGTVPNSE